jgi:beta-aspartyl-peptidase (threonine type)
VGDSPLPGCGIYADSQAGGVSASGEGEQIARSVLGARAVFAMEEGVAAQAAIEAALQRLERTGGEAGLIAIDREGRIGIAHNAVQFAVGWANGATGEVHSKISGLEETATHG